MNPNWERWSTRRARRRHAAMNTKMLRKNPPVEGIPSTLEEAEKQRMGLILNAVNREPARLRVVEHERLDPLDPEHGTWRIAFEGEGRAEAVPGEKKGEEHPPYNPYRVYLPSLLESLPGSSPAGGMSARRLVGLQDRMFPRPYTMARFETLESGSGGAFRAEITVSQVDKEMHEPDGTKVLRPARSSGFLSSLKAGDELSGWVLPEMHHFPTTLGRDVPLIVVVTGSGISGLMSLLRGGYTGGPSGSSAGCVPGSTRVSTGPNSRLIGRRVRLPGWTPPPPARLKVRGRNAGCSACSGMSAETWRPG